MTMEERIKRINELYHKSKDVGLTEEEKLEQAELRKEYIASVRGSLKAQLNNIDIKEADGSITNLGQKIKEKETECNSVRDEGLKYRRSLANRLVNEMSTEICNKVINNPYFEMAETVFLYCDYNKEVKTKEIFKRAIECGKKVAYPKCELIDGKPSIDFYYINDFNQLSKGYKDILEPDIYNNDIKKVKDFTGIIIVPGVAFDKECNRLGYGKGYYDRFLADKSSLKKIGLCYEGQLFNSVEVKETDVPVDMVITEKSIYYKK